MFPKRLKRIFLHYLVKKLLKGITVDELLRTGPNGSIICQGRILSKEDVDSIQQEAEYINNSVVMKLLLKDMKYLANQTMFEKSSSYDDMMFGKAMLYVIDILEKKISNLSK